jgi:signal transduction histidine kinase
VAFSYVDVTDTLRVERALIERNEALETADRLKSEFIANISYELRTPLNAIIGFAEVLENQFFGELNERQMEYSHAIVQSSQQLIALINDILDLATIEAGYLQLDLQPTNVHTLLDSIFTLGRERAHSRNIDLRLACDEKAGELLADGRRLRQAMFNLLSNALKFTKAEWRRPGPLPGEEPDRVARRPGRDGFGGRRRHLRDLPRSDCRPAGGCRQGWRFRPRRGRVVRRPLQSAAAPSPGTPLVVEYSQCRASPG